MERKEVDDQPTGRSIERKIYYYTQRWKKLQLNAYVEWLYCGRLGIFSTSFFSDWYCDAGDDISLSMIVHQRIWVCSLRWYHTLYVQ